MTDRQSLELNINRRLDGWKKKKWLTNYEVKPKNVDLLMRYSKDRMNFDTVWKRPETASDHRNIHSLFKFAKKFLDEDIKMKAKDYKDLDTPLKSNGISSGINQTNTDTSLFSARTALETSGSAALNWESARYLLAKHKEWQDRHAQEQKAHESSNEKCFKIFMKENYLMSNDIGTWAALVVDKDDKMSAFYSHVAKTTLERVGILGVVYLLKHLRNEKHLNSSDKVVVYTDRESIVVKNDSSRPFSRHNVPPLSENASENQDLWNVYNSLKTDRMVWFKPLDKKTALSMKNLKSFVKLLSEHYEKRSTEPVQNGPEFGRIYAKNPSLITVGHLCV